MIKNSVRLRIVIRRCMEDNLNVPIQEMSSFIGRMKADYPVPLFTKRLRQATMHKYTVNLLTLWWMPIDEQDLQDIPGFYRRLFQESECSPASGFAMESPLSRTPK